MIRTKFTCQKITIYHKPKIATVLLTLVTSDSEENQPFWKYTPAGQISLGFTNPDLYDQFVPGTDYYVDFTAV